MRTDAEMVVETGASEVRRRASRPKARTGCRTCKSRHVRCGEERPACLRCTRTGRVCGGYVPPKSRPVEKTHAVVRPKPLVLAQRSPLPFTCEATEKERMLFDYFRAHTVRRLPGSSWALSWERLALPFARQEPVILHAVVALASIERGDELELTLDQYSKVMRLAQQSIEKGGNTEVIMLASLLLFCFEVWRGDDVQARLHLRSGLRILSQSLQHTQRVESHKSGYVTMQICPSSMLELLLQTFVRLDWDLTVSATTGPFLKPTVRDDIPDVFTSLEEAMVHLDVLTTNVLDVGMRLIELGEKDLDQRPVMPLDTESRACLAKAISTRLPKHLYPCELFDEMLRYRQNLRRWMAALALMPAPAEEAARILAEIQAFSLWYDVSAWFDKDEMATDSYGTLFDHMLALAEQYVDMHRDVDANTANNGKTRPAFSLGSGLVLAVFKVAWKCRNSAVRRRSLDLLRTIDLQGVFDNHYVAAMAEFCATLEEDCARRILGIDESTELESSDIPVQAHILELDMGGRQGGSSSLYYKSNQGRLIYAYYDSWGIIQVESRIFDVKRPSMQD